MTNQETQQARAGLERRLAAVRSRIEAVQDGLITAMYVENMEQVNKLCQDMRFEVHVLSTMAAPRAELEFLARRQKYLMLELAELPADGVPARISAPRIAFKGAING